MSEYKPLNPDKPTESFLKQFNPTGSDDKLLDVRNHTAFRELMLTFYTEIYESIDRDFSKVDRIATNLLMVFGIDYSEILLNRGMRDICDDVVKRLRTKSVSINTALEKLREWKEIPIHNK